MNIEILRVAQSPKETVGVLFVDGIPFCVTLELPYRENERNISRIPSNRYVVTIEATSKHGVIPVVHDVHDRNGILIHAGNSVADTEGCILVGLSFAESNRTVTLVESRKALAELIRRARVAEAEVINLHIRECF